MSIDRSICREIRLDPRPETWREAQQQHVGDCSGCRSFLAAYAALGERLRKLPVTNRSMPEALRQTLLSALDECSAPKLKSVSGAGGKSRPRSGSFRLGARFLVPAAMAASLTIGIFLENRYDMAPAPMPAEVGEVRATVGDYIHDVTHDHYLFAKIRRPLEVAITDAESLSDWLTDALAFDFQLPLEVGSLSLEGGRVWHTVGRLSAMAVYRTDDGTQLVLFAVPAENMILSGSESQEIRGVQVFSGDSWEHEARAWIQGDLAVALTAPEGRIPEGWEQIFLPTH